MGTVKKFQCPHCKGIVVTELRDEYVICGHCSSACQVPEDFAPGTVIDDFVVVKLLGEGGMGNVYLAHQFSLDRKVALKILKDDFMRDPKFRQEFIYEARSVACLNHPNIIQAYKVGEENNVVFFAMEYVEGRNLKDILKEDGSISEKLVLSIAIEIVSALGYAWNLRKLVHRDIKPENIMMANDGTAKLMDLGLSLRDGDNKDDGDTISGTPQYISPEQILGTDMDIRGDFYCLGATLYHLVSGKLPFEGSLQEIVKQHLSAKPPSLRKAAPNVNDFFAKIIHKMMAKKPESRYESAEALLSDFNKDLQLIKDAEHGKKHFKISTQNNIRTSTGTSEFVRPKKRNDLVLLASVAMIAFLVLGFVLVKVTVGKKYETRIKKTTTTKEVSGSGSSVSNSVKIDEEKAASGLFYTYYHIKDEKSANSFKNTPPVKTGRSYNLTHVAPDKRKEFYVLVYEGVIDIKHSETYLFHIKSDDRCYLSINNKKVAEGSYRGGQGSIALSKGEYPIRIEYHQYSKSAYMDIEVESISFNKQKLPLEWLKPIGDDTQLVIDDSKKGINYEYYADIPNLPYLKRIFPDGRGIAPSPQASVENLTENYFVNYDGILQVPKPGKYYFYLNSSNRSSLSINGVKIIDEKGPDEMKSIEVELLHALNRIEIDYFHRSKDPHLKVEIEGEGIERQPIPESWFYQNNNNEYWNTKKKKKRLSVMNKQGNGTLWYKYYKGKFRYLEKMIENKPHSQGKINKLVSKKGKQDNDYGLWFTSNIFIPKTDKYKFLLDSDDKSIIKINGQQVASDRPNEESNSKFINLTRGYHSIEVLFEQGVGSHRLLAYIESDEIPKTEIPPYWYRFDLDSEEQESTTSQEPEEEADLSNGVLNYNYYETAYKDDVADIVSETVKNKGLAPDLDFKIGEKSEFYGLYFHGFLNVPESTEYTFHLSADDQSLLKIGGSELIRAKVSDGERSAKKFLKAGKHKFEVFYYQVTKPGHLNLFIESKSIKKQRIPASWYSVEETVGEKKPDPLEIIEPQRGVKENDLESGLKFNLYKGDEKLNNMDHMRKSKLVVKDVIQDQISPFTHAKDFQDNFGTVYEGYLLINNEREVEFSLNCNDVGLFYIQDKLILKASSNSGTISKRFMLKKGYYKIKLEYYQAGKSKKFELKYTNHFDKFINLMPSRLFHKK